MSRRRLGGPNRRVEQGESMATSAEIQSVVEGQTVPTGATIAIIEAT